MPQRQYARAIFRARIYGADGKQFQDLFENVLVKKHQDFRVIKPQGRKGDGGNDGYIPSLGRFFQVYAPENPSASADAAVKKAKDDFLKLLDKWSKYCAVKEFWFAYNDKFLGAHPDLEFALLEIKNDHNLCNAQAYQARHLLDDFLTLSQSDIEDIIGAMPDPSMLAGVDHAAVQEVLLAIMRFEVDPVPTGRLSAPDFEEKLKFNGLGTAVSQVIRDGNYHSGDIDDFFRKSDTYLKESVQQHLHQIYVQESSHEGLGEYPGDTVYFRMVERMAPNRRKATVDAANVLISYFFETCDVYEDPRGSA